MLLSAKRHFVIFFAALLFCSFLNADDSSGRNVFVLVEEKLYPQLDKAIWDGWIYQLKQEGWGVRVLIPKGKVSSDPGELKSYLRQQGVYRKSSSDQARANGVILIGHFPECLVHLNPNSKNASTDLYYMDASDKVRSRSPYFMCSTDIEVKPNETFDSLGVWVSRIDYNPSGDNTSRKEYIDQYLKKNTECRSSGFASNECQMEIQTSKKKFLESKSLIGLSDSDKSFTEGMIEGMTRSNAVTGDAFLGAFAKAQVEKKRLLNYLLGDEWEHWQSWKYEQSFLGLMYKSYHDSPYTGVPLPPLGKILLYYYVAPLLFVTVPGTVLLGWALPYTRKYLGAMWALTAAAAITPLGIRSHYYLPARHYLPTLLGDGTLRKTN